MESLPDIKVAEYPEIFTPSEQSLLEKLKESIQDEILQALGFLETASHSASTNAEKPLLKDLKAYLLRLDELVSKVIPNSLLVQKTKKELDSLKSVIVTTEKLAFLIRYFNWDNDENYNKFLTSRVPKAHSIIYSFNMHLQNLVKSIVQNIEPNNNALLQFVQHSSEPTSFQFGSDFFSIKTPVVLSRAQRDPSSVILLEYYYLERAYNALKEILTISAPEQVRTKTKQNFKRLAGAPEHEVENSKRSAGSLKDFMNIDEIVGLEKELENVEDLKENEQILKYLFASKRRLDELVNQAKEKLNNNVEKPSSLRSVKTESPSNSQKQEGSLPLEKVDDILSTEIKGYNAQAGKTLKAYWQELSEEIRQEVIRMVSLDKFLLQSVYLSIYFEQRYVVFYSSSTHFVNENFAKLIEDFCYTANKEYKSMPAVTNQQGVHPLYYCYVAENKQDFYLVEYHPNSPLLRVYMTAAPMLATLHKHLAKLDITKIAKKSFHVTRLNFYDSEVGIELRNLLINSKLKKEDDSDEEDEYGISRNFRYFIFITIFLINNSPILAGDFEVNFTTKDLITFYNYLAEYQNISLKNQEENQPIPDIFEFCYPFVNLREKREAYLLFNKKDPAKELSILSIKSLYALSKDLPNFVPLNFEEETNSQTTLRHEILEYLRRNKDKSTFNFDGSTYILDYLKRNFQSQLDASQSPGKAFQVFSKEQTQRLLEIFVSGAKDHELLKNLASCSTAAKVCMLFSGRPESMGLLMISYEKKRRRCTAYLWDSKEGRDEQALGEFVEYIRELIQEENKDVNETIDSRFVYCKPNDELITHYFRHHYFPFTCLIDRDALNPKELAVTLGTEDLVDPFKYFLSVNIAENNLELFKVYSKMLEEKMFQQWEIANVATMWKFSELKYTLQVLSEKLIEESIENILISFSFLGAMGSKVYYLYLREQQQSPNSSPEELVYLVDLYSLTYNLDLDDQEIIALVYQCCKLSPRVRLILNAAYQINPKNNILLYTQVEITLTTLGYLVHFCNFSMEKAFQKIAQSVVVHYEILEELMSHSEASGKTKGGSRHQETAPIKMELAPESPQREMNEQGVKFKVYQSYFEELLKENQFKKKIESEIPGLLKTTVLDSGEDPEAMDIASFLNQLNCEVTPPLTFFFATNELFTKRVISNENNILTDKSVYAFLIKELTSSKAKYEEALELRYQQTSIYFILPINLMQTHQTPIVNFNVESHKITYYYINSQNKPQLQENIFSFIESLSVKLASGSTQTMKAASSRELKVNACPIVLADDVSKILETQYPLIVKALIRLSSRRDIMREEKILLNMERLNNFMCEYAEDLFTQNVEVSKVKENYRYLSNLFLQKDSPLTKNIALLTFLNGTASIEQLGVIHNCIKSFKDDFDKIAGIEHAFFGFNVSVKNSIKHYLLHLTAHENGGSTLRLFTNLLGDADNVIDRMIQSYCVEQQDENQEDKRKVEQLLLFKINIPNTVFARYLEISSLLIANAVCNGTSDSNEYCAKLALSPIHYFDELKNFEEKCEQLNLFQGAPSSETQV